MENRVISKELMLEYTNHCLSQQQQLMENPQSIEKQWEHQSKITIYQSLINMIHVGAFDISDEVQYKKVS